MKKLLKQTTSLVFVATLSIAGAASAQDLGPRLWISDSGTRTVYEVPLEGGLPLRSFHTPENARSGLAIDPVDYTFWAASEQKLDTTFGSLVHYDEDETMLVEIDAGIFGGFGVEGVAVDYFDGSLWVVDDPIGPSEFEGEIPTVHQVERDGTPISSFPASNFDSLAVSMQGIAADPFDGTLWITDNTSDTVYNVDRDGTLISSFRPKDVTPLASNPQGISVDEADGTIWVTDRNTGKIYNFTRTGQLNSSFESTVFDADSSNPTTIAYDAKAATTMLRTVIADLYAIVDFLPADVAGDDSLDRIEILGAIERIENSLDSKRWLNQWRPHPNRKVGAKVFKQNEFALEHLLNVANMNGATDVSQAIVTLTNIHYELARAAYDRATAEEETVCAADPSSEACSKANGKIGEADKKFAEAQKELDNGNPDVAVLRYKQAWKKSIAAINHLYPGNSKPKANADGFNTDVGQAV